MRLACGLLSFVLFVATDAVGQLTGSWSGTYTAVSTACQPSVPHGGISTVTVSQAGSSISGTLSIEVFLVDCHTATASAPSPSQTQVVSFNGAVTGDAFSGTFPTGPSGSGTLSGTLHGDELVVTFVAGDTTATGRFTRDGTPPANFAGEWTGNYTAVATACSPAVAMTGVVSAELAQSGNALTGTLSIQQPYTDCAPDSRTATVAVQGSVTGRSFAGTFDARPTRYWPVGSIRGSFDGNAIVFSVVSGDTTATGTVSKPSSRHRAAKH